MYELYRYILPFHKTNFNPFRLAAAIASCSPPSPASGDGFHKASALSARHFFLSTCAHTPRIAEFEAKPRDFRMERHVLGSGRSVSGAQGKAMRLSDIKQITDTKKERPLIRALFFIISKIHTARLYPQAWDPWGCRGGRRRPSRTAQGRVYPRALLCL